MIRTLLLHLVAVASIADPAGIFLPTGPGPYHIASGDLNGDGRPDLVVPCRGELLSPELKEPANNTVSVFLSKQNGGVSAAITHKVGFGPYTAAIGDLDGDGLVDVAVANFQSNDGRDLSILYGGRNRPDLFEPAQHLAVVGGGFENQKSASLRGLPVFATPGLTSVALGDFNRDGRIDIVAVAWTSDFLVVFLNEGTRTFKQRRFPMLPGPRDVVVGDFDGDGLADAAITIYSSNLVEVWKGDGKGGFAFWRRFHSAGQVPYHLKAGDLDQDGRLDLVVGNRGVHDNVTVFRNTPDDFVLVGSFSPETPVKGEATADEIRDVHLRDVNNDGKLDLITACHLSHKVVTWLGTGDLRFGKSFRDPKTLLYPGKGPRAIAAMGSKVVVALFDSNEIVVIDSVRLHGGTQ